MQKKQNECRENPEEHSRETEWVVLFLAVNFKNIYIKESPILQNFQKLSCSG